MLLLNARRSSRRPQGGGYRRGDHDQAQAFGYEQEQDHE
jgi:hypothetical protein